MFRIEVAVPTPLHRTFTYLSAEPIPSGCRVLVPFGRRQLVGVVLGPAVQKANGEDDTFELKAIDKIIDETPIYSKVLLDVARWMSAYYLHPLGEVLRVMLPASSTKVVRETFALTDDGVLALKNAASPKERLLLALFGRKKAEMSALVLRAKLKKLRLAGHPDAENLQLKDLKRAGLVTPTKGTSMRARAAGTSGAHSQAKAERHQSHADNADNKQGDASRLDSSQLSTDSTESASPTPSLPRALTALQQAAFDRIVTGGLKAPASRVFLLHGVTGSGKTEIYLQLIGEAMRQNADAQALVLVPEISLTPQMTRVFSSRFPGLVAVVHSVMTDTDRWTELGRIRDGKARILIGPRSAVFGAFKKLSLLLVDEEHDNSYKQSSGLTYNGRDVAVLRARLEGVPVVLGSATPSMESYNNARSGRYTLIEMPERVTGRALPDIEVIEVEKRPVQGTLLQSPSSSLRQALADGSEASDIPIDPRIEAALRENHALGRQAIVLVNRRGYAYYLFSLDEKKAVQCPYCSISMTLHAKSTVLRCHYCNFQTDVQKVSAEKAGQTLVAVGYGSQKAEDNLAKLLPGARVVRLDSDSVADREALPRILGAFRRQEIDVLVGTQILAKGHDFPNVTLIVILEVDQLLGLPDFRAGERTFQLMVQAAGRAGRADLPGRVLIQTMRSSHPVVTAALKQDFQTFAERELEFRRAMAYPPFTRMIGIEFNARDQRKLVQVSRRVEVWVDQMAAMQPQVLNRVRILGPSTPPIERVRSRYRRCLILAGDQIEPLRHLAQQFCQTFQKLPPDVRMKIDVDPQNLI